MDLLKDSSNIFPTQVYLKDLFSSRMKFSILILAFAVGVSLAYDPVFVDELEDIVTSRSDERELDRLDDNKYMIRYFFFCYYPFLTSLSASNIPKEVSYKNEFSTITKHLIFTDVSL